MKLKKSKSKRKRKSVSRPKQNYDLLQNTQTYSMVFNREQKPLGYAQRSKIYNRKVSKNQAMLNLKINTNQKKLESLKQRQVHKSKYSITLKNEDKKKRTISRKRNASVKINSINEIKNSIKELFQDYTRSVSQRNQFKQRSKSITQALQFNKLTLKETKPIDILYQKAQDNLQDKGKFQVGKSYGYYSMICSRGLIKNVNEDKYLQILNKKINQKDQSIFGIFDGHSSTNKPKNLCSQFLKNKFGKVYEKICKDKPQLQTDQILKLTLENLENEFLQQALQQKNKTGSCVNVFVLENKKITCANIGDSKTVIVENNGKNIIELSKDHKPNHSKEKQRIIKNGGTVKKINNKGPYRVFPGGLAVSRAIGNAHMKYNSKKQKVSILISDADTQSYNITKNTEFLIQSSDGIYQKLKPKEIVKIFYNEILNLKKQKFSIQEKVDLVLKNSLQKILSQRLTDNITIYQEVN